MVLITVCITAMSGRNYEAKKVVTFNTIQQYEWDEDKVVRIASCM